MNMGFLPTKGCNLSWTFVPLRSGTEFFLVSQLLKLGAISATNWGGCMPVVLWSFSSEKSSAPRRGYFWVRGRIGGHESRRREEGTMQRKVIPQPSMKWRGKSGHGNERIKKKGRDALSFLVGKRSGLYRCSPDTF
jgi:hypothetical protein